MLESQDHEDLVQTPTKERSRERSLPKDLSSTCTTTVPSDLQDHLDPQDLKDRRETQDPPGYQEISESMEPPETTDHVV